MGLRGAAQGVSCQSGDGGGDHRPDADHGRGHAALPTGRYRAPGRAADRRESDPALCRQSAVHLVVRLEHASRQSLFVNVTTNDFVRRPYYRGPLSAMSEAQLSAHITEHIMPRVNWFRFNPEVLAVVTGGWLGLKPHIEMSEFQIKMRFFATTAEAVEASSASIYKVK